MNKIVQVIFISIIFLTSCYTKNDNNYNNYVAELADSLYESAPADTSRSSPNEVYLESVKHYFASKRFSVPSMFVFEDEAIFEEFFNPARTMSSIPTLIDFSTQLVGAIILPASSNNTSISLNESYIDGKILNILYSIREEPSARSYSVVPVKIFAFDRNLKVDSVAFVNGAGKVLVALAK